MDFIDNLIYTTHSNTGHSTTVRQPLKSNGLGNIYGSENPQPKATSYQYEYDDRRKFVEMEDPTLIEQAFEKHWYDIMDKLPAPEDPITSPWPPAAITAARAHYVNKTDPNKPFFVTDLSEPLYHMIYAYLIENTRIPQIFERLVTMYQQGEELGITSENYAGVFRWINNTEYLFFRQSGTRNHRNVTSILRPDSEANRRNGYYRMFGMDLPFGDKDGKSASYPYVKAKAANSTFIVLFEQFLSEIWHAYINADNKSGVNTADLTNTKDLIKKIKELFEARRGSATNYAFKNLSREEYSSCFMMSWFHLAISDDKFPLLDFLGCKGSSEGDRLTKIGKRVGIPAHSKCQALVDLAVPLANLLKLMEDSTDALYDDLDAIIASKATKSGQEFEYLNQLIMIINNWEKATGHKIKNRESNINGTVKIAQIARGTLVTN